MRRLSFLLTVFLLLTFLVGCGGSTSIPYLSELSAQRKTEVEVAWQKQYGKELLWNESDDYVSGHARYYGTYKGMVFWFIADSDVAATGSITVAGQKMIWGYDFNIYVYVDETVCTISQAYSRELLSDKDVNQIAAIHDHYVIQKYGKKW